MELIFGVTNMDKRQFPRLSSPYHSPNLFQICRFSATNPHPPSILPFEVQPEDECCSRVFYPDDPRLGSPVAEVCESEAAGVLKEFEGGGHSTGGSFQLCIVEGNHDQHLRVQPPLCGVPAWVRCMDRARDMTF